MVKNNGVKTQNSGGAILDSSLISATIKSLYNIKIVDMNTYLQVYIYKNKVLRSKKVDNSDLNLKNKNISNLLGDKKKTSNDIELTNNIELKNIMRSKLMCQRLAKSNIEEWETFITLTFEDTEKFDVTSITDCNKRLKYFIDKVKRVKKDFKYLCIPEFQKRGAVHYHLLTNVNINDNKLMYTQQDNSKFKHIKYWIDGFSSVEIIKGDPKKVVGYISKYMTKDIDNRLFSKHRYFYSKNLNVPVESYIDLEDNRSKEFYLKKIQDKALIYHNEYLNPYDSNNVTFLEFCKDNTII